MITRPRLEWCRIATLGVIAGGRVDIHLETEAEYRDMLGVGGAGLQAWNGYGFELLGPIVDRPSTVRSPGAFVLEQRRAAAPFYATAPPGQGAPAIVVEVWRLRAFADPHGFFAELEWTPDGGWRAEAIRGPWRDAYDESRIRGAQKAGRLLLNLPALLTRGPKAGRVKAQKYKSPEQWRAAIRERVLPRNTLPEATGREVARWLGISKAKLYELMADWGPPSSLDDLKAGKF